MRIIKINPKKPSLKTIKIAAEIIKKGGVIIYPTDTIYGIGASALNQEAVNKVYKIKARSKNKPLSAVISDIAMAKKYCEIGETREEIFSALLPGAFTLILKVKSAKRKDKLMHDFNYLKNQSKVKIQKCIFTGFKNTLSLRIPDCKITELLSKELKIPFTATSANISGFPGNGDINKVLKQFGIDRKKPESFRSIGIDLVLDAGILPKKNPSMIIDLTGEKPKIIRK